MKRTRVYCVHMILHMFCINNNTLTLHQPAYEIQTMGLISSMSLHVFLLFFMILFFDCSIKLYFRSTPCYIFLQFHRFVPASYKVTIIRNLLHCQLKTLLSRGVTYLYWDKKTHNQEFFFTSNVLHFVFMSYHLIFFSSLTIFSSLQLSINFS